MSKRKFNQICKYVGSQNLFEDPPVIMLTESRVKEYARDKFSLDLDEKDFHEIAEHFHQHQKDVDRLLSEVVSTAILRYLDPKPIAITPKAGSDSNAKNTIIYSRVSSEEQLNVPVYIVPKGQEKAFIQAKQEEFDNHQKGLGCLIKAYDEADLKRIFDGLK